MSSSERTSDRIGKKKRTKRNMKRFKTHLTQKIFFIEFDTNLKKRNMFSEVRLRCICIVCLAFESLRVKNLHFRTSGKRHLLRT
ncbi:hypothetical protein LEP1GSC016_4145 [Leptospira borgpetersenii serovar Hardjo-bovis str. Sponselee]|uniref:Uncharacterized protein n=1 Tax=Leptospira borgpetersenii serovar Hardjo-bovis str. Sponselee TaxID=1303729 RepID=M6C1I2_LEPBO|nr:hypothetical protein LEP1GSC016_4145 [Leptospira borgpetersenii serovar Hardjo-bovis str. Sponselee]